MSNCWELKWTDCSGGYGNYRPIKGKFCFRLTDDLIIATVGVCRWEDNKIEAYLEDKHHTPNQKKIFKYKTEEELELKVEEAKQWLQREMLKILEENAEAIKKMITILQVA